MESFFIEVNILKKKWQLSCSYNPCKTNISNHLHHLNKGLDVFLKSFENVLNLPWGDLNLEVTENYLNGYCDIKSLKTPTRDPTCFKSSNNSPRMDMFLTNRPQCFQQTCTIETSVSDLHKMIVTVTKILYKKQKSKSIQYRKSKHLNEQSFNSELNNELLKIEMSIVDLQELHDIF